MNPPEVPAPSSKFRGNLRVPASELAEHPDWYEGCQITPVDDRDIFVVKFPPRVRAPKPGQKVRRRRSKRPVDRTVWRDVGSSIIVLCSGRRPEGACGQLATVTADGLTFLCDRCRLADDEKHQWNGALKRDGLSTKLDRVRPFRRT